MHRVPTSPLSPVPEISGAGKPNEASGPPRKTKKHYIRTLSLDRTLISRLKSRVTLAKRIADAGIAKEKNNHEDAWLRNAAEDLGVEYDSDDFHSQAAGRKGGGGKGQGRKKNEQDMGKLSKAEVSALRAELKALLGQRVNVGVSERYLTSGGVDVNELLRGGVRGDFLGRVGSIGLDD